MDAARSVWVVTDGRGRQLARFAWGRRQREAWLFLAVVLPLLLALAVVHGLACHSAAERARLLAQAGPSQRQAIGEVAALVAELTPLTERCRIAMTLLEQKSGTHFVDLAAGQHRACPSSHGSWAGGPAPGGPAAQANDLLLAEQALNRGRALEALEGQLLEYWHDAERRLANTPSIRPARTAWLSSSFGMRTDPIHHATVMHKGLDMAGFIGMLVYAPADGRVIWTGTRGGYGQVVVLDHGWGLQTHFAHLSNYLVERGQRVQRGTPIAEMGNTGKSTGPHLHYEVRLDGYPIDPRNFILD